MSKPFFSVMIPTRGRTHVVEWAIRSVLDQTFTDLECVVIDNNLDDRVAKICAPITDSRLRRVKTGSLNMPDNWEQAYLSAQGIYAIVIEDRQCIYHHALEFIHRLVLRDDLQCLGWSNDYYTDAVLPARIRRHGGKRNLKRVQSDHILEGISGRKPNYDPMEFIVAQKCVVKVDLLQQIRARTGHKIAMPVAADRTVGLNIINALESYHCFDGSLTLSHSDQISTGHSFHRDRNSINEFWTSVGGKEMAYSHVPVKACFNENTGFNDYIRMTEAVGGRLKNHPLNMVYYYTRLANYLISAMEEGYNWSEEWTAWKKALAKESSTLRTNVNKNLADRKRRRFLQQLRIGLGIRVVERFIKSARNEQKEKSRIVQQEETQAFVPEFVASESLLLAQRDLSPGPFDAIKS